MKSWWNEWKQFWNNKYYVLALAFTAIASYGFMITHHTIGIDDTPYAAYFEEGLAAIVGRWVLFLLNKVMHLSDFAPFLTDFVGVLILMAAVTVWCVLLKRIFKDRIPVYGYILFACLFLSNPLISEVYTYYLHNGIAIGYFCSGAALCCFWEGLQRFQEENKKAKFMSVWLGSAVFLWIAIGCYESFMVVYLVGVCLVLCSNQMVCQRKGKKEPYAVLGSKEKEAVCEVDRGAEPKRNGKLSKIGKKSVPWCDRIIVVLVVAALIGVVALLLRSLMVAGVTAVFGLEGLKEEAVQRSVTELAGWITDEGAAAQIGMIVKRVLVMYGVFACAYYPIAIYVFAAAIIVLVSLWQTIKRRNIWIFLLAIGSFIASYLLIFIEGKATLYRSAQFLPLISAWGLLLLLFGLQEFLGFVHNWKLKSSLGTKGVPREKVTLVINLLAGMVLAVIIWNQCTDMNQWFYVDYLKYEDAKETMNQVAYELEKNFDTNKPVIFTGTYKLPVSILAETYIPYNSPVFYQMNRLAGVFDEHILEKFYREQGVWVAQTPSLSVMEWARTAFGGDEELVRFFSMHGHSLTAPKDKTLYNIAEQESLNLPSFPEQGSIVDKGEYLIVHF